MAKKLTLDLSVEQMRTLNDAAVRLAATTAGEERLRWQAIARESSRTLAYVTAERGKPSGATEP